MPIKAKLNLSKIDKNKVFEGKNGKYLDIVLIETPNDKYGNDWMVVEDTKKDQPKGNILGNGKNSGGRSQSGNSTSGSSTSGNNGTDDLPW